MNRLKKTLITFALVLSTMMTELSASPIPESTMYPVGTVLHQATAPDPIVVLVSSFNMPNENEAALQPTIQALLQAFGSEKLHIEVFRGGIVEPQAADLILTSSGAYRRHTHLGTRDLATLISKSAPNPNMAEASSFVVRADRSDIQTLADLKDKKLAATSPYSFAGYQIAAHELFLNGYNSEQFFSESFWTAGMPKALNMIRDKQADVAVVRACVLEELKAQGIDISDFKVIHVKKSPLICQASTDTYPNWTFYATARASSEVARKAASALLNMPQTQGFAWSIATDFTKVDRLFYDLKIGPYEYRRHWTFQQFWEDYGQWIVCFLIVFFGFVLHSWRSEVLLTRRSRELNLLRLEAQDIADKLMNLQRVGIIGQISTIIAHELRQPLSACVNYLHGLERLIEQNRNHPDLYKRAFGLLEEELSKMDAIVERVRTYAKNQRGSREVINLTDIISKASDDLKRLDIFRADLILKIEKDLPIKANPLEMRLVAINLIKNALQAADTLESAGSIKPSVIVTAHRQAEMIEFCVQDNGPVLTPEAFANILKPLQSNKVEGLGLGLTIVRLIIENHGGTLSVEQIPKGGLVFTIELPLMNI